MPYGAVASCDVWPWRGALALPKRSCRRFLARMGATRLVSQARGPFARRGASRVDAIVRKRVARRAPRPAARHSPADRARESGARTNARIAQSSQSRAPPAWPIMSCPAASATRDNSWPTAPPSPAGPGHSMSWTCISSGMPASVAAQAGSAQSRAITRRVRLPRPRCEAMRQAQPSIASAGSRPASPNAWTSRSATMAPGVPARLVGAAMLAVSNDGSCGLYDASAISVAKASTASPTPHNSASRRRRIACRRGEASPEKRERIATAIEHVPQCMLLYLTT